MPQHQCPNCGKFWPEQIVVCPNCREPIRAGVQIHAHGGGRANGQTIRRGLLYMLLAAVFHYFASGSSPLLFPFAIPPFLTQTLLPFLFLAGLGMTALGVFRRATA